MEELLVLPVNVLLVILVNDPAKFCIPPPELVRAELLDTVVFRIFKVPEPKLFNPPPFAAVFPVIIMLSSVSVLPLFTNAPPRPVFKAPTAFPAVRVSLFIFIRLPVPVLVKIRLALLPDIVNKLAPGP